jgi:hypothetical protein
LCNGNVRTETDLIRMAAPWLLSSSHQDPAVAASQKVLLITTAWAEHEYEEAHLKAALAAVGLPAGWDTLQNLGAWHAYREFSREARELAEPWEAREHLMDTTRSLYLEKNAFFTARLRQTLGKTGAERRLADIMADPTPRVSHLPARFDGAQLLSQFLEADIKDTVSQLIDNDDRMVELLRDLEDHFAAATGLFYHPGWQRLRRQMEERILSANAIMLFGGTLGVLHRCLGFFRLGEVLHEALRRGTTFFSVSAGSLALCERIIIYDDYGTEGEPRREFQLFDRGFGLVRHLQIFPHCMDRIQTDDTDNLSYLAWRFQNRTCVGLNEDSLLLIEAQPRLRCVSVGAGDGVYVFGLDGQKQRYDQGDEIPLA